MSPRMRPRKPRGPKPRRLLLEPLEPRQLLAAPGSLSGWVYADANNDGIRQVGEAPIAGVRITLTGIDERGRAASATAFTNSGGEYKFNAVTPGTYRLQETQPAGYLDGVDTLGSQGGVASDDQFWDIVVQSKVSAVDYNFAELPPASLAGAVYVDENDDGVRQWAEPPIAGVKIALSGTDDRGKSVARSVLTDGNGAYWLGDLRPGQYALAQTQPAHYRDGQDQLGTQGGVAGNDLFSGIVLSPGTVGESNDFGERLNQAPTAEGQSLVVAQDTTQPITLTGSDPDGDPLTYRIVTPLAHGTLSGTAPDLIYTPASGYSGPDHFTFVVFDCDIESATATVAITVQPLNSPPVAEGQSAATNEDEPLAITLSGRDVDGDPLTYTVVTPPAHGALSGLAPNLTYVPAADYNGGDSFTFEVTDGMFTSALAIVAILVSPVNDAPVAAADSYSTQAGTPLTVSSPGILTNDRDADGDSLIAVLVSAPSHGTLTLNADGSLSFTPAADFTGSDSFTYKVSDGTVDSAIARVAITVNATDHPLVAHWALDETSGTLAADATAHGNAAVLGPVGSEPIWGPGYKGGALVFDGVNDRAQATNVPVDQTAGGKNTIAFWMKWNGQQGPMPVSVGPFALWISSERFGFNTGVGDQLAMSGFTAAQYKNRWIHVAAVFVNPDTTRAGWETAWAAESKLHIDGVEQKLTQFGSPAARIFESAVTLGASSSGGPYYFGGAMDDVRIYSRELTTAEVTKLASLRAVDDAYPRNKYLPLNVTAASGVLANDTVADRRTLTTSLVVPPAHGTVSLNSDGSFVYTPNVNYFGGDSFAYRINDGMSDSNLANVTITSDAPVAVQDSYVTHLNTPVTYGAAGGVLANDTDADDDPLTAVLVDGPAHGSLTLNSNGSFTYTPSADYLGPDAFTYKANDGTTDGTLAIVSITVNDTPKAVPELARWESEMQKFGKLHGDRFLDQTYDYASTYYDAQRLYLQIADYTGDPSWLQYADRAGAMYRDDFVRSSRSEDGGYGAVPGYWNFTRGLAEDYLRTKDTLSKEAAVQLSHHASYTSTTCPIEWTAGVALSREVAYAIVSYIDAERVGEARRERLALLFEQALGHLNQWFIDKSDPTFAPFMFGLTAEALIYYWDHVNKDPRILEKLKLGADEIWRDAWIADKEAFFYRADGPNNAAPDLNMLIAPLYSWLYLQTGDATYRDRGDQIFAGGVKGAYLDASKQFNQNYRWSFDYLKWRSQADNSE